MNLVAVISCAPRVCDGDTGWAMIYSASIPYPPTFSAHKSIYAVGSRQVDDPAGVIAEALSMDRIGFYGDLDADESERHFGLRSRHLHKTSTTELYFVFLTCVFEVLRL